jgi:uncharacterized protein (UPF0333 family)
MTAERRLSFKEDGTPNDANFASPPTQVPRIGGVRTFASARSLLQRVTVLACSPHQIELSLNHKDDCCITADDTEQEIEVVSTTSSTETSTTDSSNILLTMQALALDINEDSSGDTIFEERGSPQKDDEPIGAYKDDDGHLSIGTKKIFSLLFMPGNSTTNKAAQCAQQGTPLLPLFASATLGNIRATLFPPTTPFNESRVAVAANTVAPALGNTGNVSEEANTVVDMASTLGNKMPAANSVKPIFAPTLGNTSNLAPTLGNNVLVELTVQKWTRPAAMILAESLNFNVREEGGNRPVGLP